MENLFNNKSFITNESELSHAIKKIADGDIQAYCNLKDFFLYRFPLIPLWIKNKYRKFTFETMKDIADKSDNTFAKAFVGWMLWSGTGAKQNDELAKIYINNSAKEHNPIGLVELGLLHLVGSIEGKPNRYTAVNLFEEAFQDKSNGYAALALGILNDIDGRTSSAITYLQKALSLEISDAAAQLASIYLLKSKYEDAFQLYSSTPHIPTSIFNLGFIFYGIAPDRVKSDYVRSFQCFLIAQALGHPYAEFYISHYKKSPSIALNALSSEIAINFNTLINDYESSTSEITKTMQDIFNEMKSKFESLQNLNITKSMLNSRMSIDDFVNFCYYQCVLSSKLICNLQVSTEENKFQLMIDMYNQEIFKSI